MSQIKRIEQWLRDGNTIDTFTAFTMFGCARLSARISDLKHSGMNIVSIPKHNKDKRWVEYKYVKRNEKDE